MLLLGLLCMCKACGSRFCLILGWNDVFQTSLALQDELGSHPLAIE